MQLQKQTRRSFVVNFAAKRTLAAANLCLQLQTRMLQRHIVAALDLDLRQRDCQRWAKDVAGMKAPLTANPIRLWRHARPAGLARLETAGYIIGRRSMHTCTHVDVHLQLAVRCWALFQTAETPCLSCLTSEGLVVSSVTVHLVI